MLSRNIVLCLLLLFALRIDPSQAQDPFYQIFAYVFDLDDNIVRLPTTIVLFHQTTGAELEISTAQYAEISQEIGKVGTPWATYKVDFSDPIQGSFRHFRDDAHQQKFYNDIRLALRDPNHAGDSLLDFRFATSNPMTAKTTWINTSRGHEAKTISIGTLLLGASHPVPEENIYAVSNPLHAPLGKTTAEKKARVVIQLLNELQERVNHARTKGESILAYPVVNSAGTGLALQHLFGFSDDDPKFIETVSNAIQGRMYQNLWPDFKIRMIYTGKLTAYLSPGSFIITPSGARRPQLEIERGEAKRILRHLLWDQAQRQIGCAQLLDTENF